MINEEALSAYLLREFRGASDVSITKLGSGVQGSGFLVSMQTAEGEQSYVVKGLFPEGLGHDYPSDRAGVFLLDLEEYGNLPGHVKAIDVLAEMNDGTVKSIAEAASITFSWRGLKAGITSMTSPVWRLRKGLIRPVSKRSG